jgi:Spy/CpxP family protein refolding chaperone
MKTWIRRTLIAVLGAAAVLGGLAACAHRGHDWQAMSAEDSARFKTKMIERVSDKLALDATQKAKLSVLADKVQEQHQALKGKTPDVHADIAALISGPSFDRARAQALVQAKTSAITSKSPEVIAAAADFYDSLRPEQQQKVRDLIASRHRRG